MKKITKKNRMVLSGLLVGLASLGAVASYFDLNQDEMRRALIITLGGFAGIVLLAALAVVLIKLPGIIMRRMDAQPGNGDSKQE